MTGRDISGESITWLDAMRMVEDHGTAVAEAAVKASVEYTQSMVADLASQLNAALAGRTGKEHTITLRLEPASAGAVPLRRRVVRDDDGNIAEIVDEPT